MASFSNFGKNLILTFITLLITLGLSEIGVRLFVTVRNVGPSFTVYDPVFGKRIKKSVSYKRFAPEFTMRFTTNSLGFRGPEPESFPQRPILFLGDSFTMGYGVNDDEVYVERIRKTLFTRNKEKYLPVINNGMGVNGNGRWIKFLKTKGPHYSPRLVVLQFHYSDFDENVRERLFDLTASGELHERKVPAPGRDRQIQTLIETVPGLAYSHLVALGRQLRWIMFYRQDTTEPTQNLKNKAKLSDNETEPPYAERLTFRIVEEVLKICDIQKWPVLALNIGVEGTRLDKLRNFLLKHNVHLIDTPAKAQRPDLFYKVDGHWNARGHAFAADLMLKELAGFDL